MSWPKCATPSDQLGPPYCAQQLHGAEGHGVNHLYLMTGESYQLPQRGLQASQDAIFPALAYNHSPELLNPSFSAGSRRWRSRSWAMKSVHAGSSASCRYRSRTLVRYVHARW